MLLLRSDVAVQKEKGSDGFWSIYGAQPQRELYTRLRKFYSRAHAVVKINTEDGDEELVPDVEMHTCG